MKTSAILLLLPALWLVMACEKDEDTTNNSTEQTPAYTYKIVDTDVSDFYDNNAEISAPVEGAAFFGQDANYDGFQPSYTDNGDGTVSDNVTELMWSQAVNLNKVTLDEAHYIADTMTLAGYSDWRVPNIKELYSLILFSGYTGSQTDYYSIPLIMPFHSSIRTALVLLTAMWRAESATSTRNGSARRFTPVRFLMASPAFSG